MTSSSENGRLKAAAFFSGSTDAVGSKLYGVLTETLKHKHCDLHETNLRKTKLNECDGCYAAGGRVCMLPCDYNDVEAEIYDSTDKGVLVHDTVTSCDVLLLVSEARCGGLDSSSQRLLERLIPYEHLLHRKGQDLLTGKAAIVLAVGDGADAAVSHAASRLSALGFTIPAHGAIAVEVPQLSREAGLKSLNGDSRFRSKVQAAVDSAVAVVQGFRRR